MTTKYSVGSLFDRNLPIGGIRGPENSFTNFIPLNNDIIRLFVNAL